jgi:hypothetical protein
MNTFLQEMSKKAAERWASVLLGPGLLFVACVLVARHQGFTRGLDLAGLRAYAGSVVTDPAYQEPAGLVVAAAIVLLGAVVAALTASCAGGLVERLWLPAGPDWYVRPLVRWRTWRWNRKDQAYRVAEAVAAQELARDRRRGGPRHDNDGHARVLELRRLLARRNAYAERRPDEPTWMAQRMADATARVDERYGMDLAEMWPHVWSVADSQVREDVQGVRDSFGGAGRTAAWGGGLLGLAAVTFWWPAAVLGVVLLITGYRRGRAAIDILVPLIESTVDLYLRDVADRMGITCPHAFSPEQAERVRHILRVQGSNS